MNKKLAIDVGGVLIEKKDRSGPDTNFDLDNVKWIDGALDAVRILSQNYDLYILSFCGKRTEMETREALRSKIAKWIPEEKWIFTRKREHKVDQMQKHGITWLIDDTASIIKWVDDAGLIGLHFGSQRFPDWAAVTPYLTNVTVKPRPFVYSSDNFPALTRN